MKDKYYRFELFPTKEPEGFTTAAMRSCIGCGRVLSDMGGGGKYICQSCLDNLCSGSFARALLRMEEIEVENQASKGNDDG